MKALNILMVVICLWLLLVIAAAALGWPWMVTFLGSLGLVGVAIWAGANHRRESGFANIILGVLAGEFGLAMAMVALGESPDANLQQIGHAGLGIVLGAFFLTQIGILASPRL